MAAKLQRKSNPQAPTKTQPQIPLPAWETDLRRIGILWYQSNHVWEFHRRRGSFTNLAESLPIQTLQVWGASFESWFFLQHDIWDTRIQLLNASMLWCSIRNLWNLWAFEIYETDFHESYYARRIAQGMPSPGKSSHHFHHKNYGLRWIDRQDSSLFRKPPWAVSTKNLAHECTKGNLG